MDLARVFDEILGHFVEICSKLMLVLPMHYFFPDLPKYLAEYFFSYSAIMRMLGIDTNDFR
jgi:hypothetical protein